MSLVQPKPLFGPPEPHLVFLEASPAVYAWLEAHPETEIIHDAFKDDGPVHLRLVPVPGQPGTYTLRSRLSWTFLNLYLTWWLKDIVRETGEPITRMTWKLLETGKLGDVK